MLKSLTSTSFLFLLFCIVSCNPGKKFTPTQPEIPPRDQITMGNGADNIITVDNFKQAEKVFTFEQVKIVGNGWLVMHPFKDGKPVPTVYVGATYLKHGVNKNVEIEVKDVPKSEEQYIIMLHWDVDQDKEFDFGDGIDVLDAPVFEGTKMIAFPFKAKS